MTLRRFKFDKLIRDKAADIMRGLGIIVHDRVMDHQEKVGRLKEKLVEGQQVVFKIRYHAHKI